MIKEKIMKFVPLLIFILALVITRWVKNVTDVNSSFKYYNHYNVKSEKIKQELVYDPYFIQLTNLDYYDGNISMDNMDELLEYYKSNITKNKTKSFIDYRNEFGFCISKKDFLNSFKELFGKDISNYYDKLEDIEFVYLKNKSICFKSDEPDDHEFNFVLIKDISYEGDNISANLYKYEINVYEKDVEDEIKTKINYTIEHENYSEFNNDVVNTYNGTIYEKNIKYIDKTRGEYFKYQLVSINSK